MKKIIVFLTLNFLICANSFADRQEKRFSKFNKWLAKNEKKNTPENIPLKEILKNIPGDRVNFSHQSTKQTNNQENKKIKPQTERKETKPQNKTTEKLSNDTERNKKDVPNMSKKSNLENRKVRPSYLDR